MGLNPTTPNEDFQTSQVRQYAEAIYSETEKKLVAAIVETLGLEGDKDSEGAPIVMTIDYAYKKLVDAGFMLNHKFIESEGTCSLQIDIYTKTKTYTHDVKTTYSTSIT